MTNVENSSINSSDIEFRFILPLFFKLIDSIRYSTNLNPIYHELQKSIKDKTTRDIKKIARYAAIHFLSRLRENRDYYSNNKHEVAVLKYQALNQATARVENE